VSAANGLDALIADLIESIGASAKPYDEVISAWRTSCPRLPVWEDANDRGFVARDGTTVFVTESGWRFVESHRPPLPDPRRARP
jgi:hypothetical protein